MSTFQPDKLSVEYSAGVTAAYPILQRRYTLTHSDETGKLFLTIGTHYAWEKMSALRDEVLGEWTACGMFFYFFVHVSVDQGQLSPAMAAKRNEIFRRELPLALQAIRYGDQTFFTNYPYLDYTPIIVNFSSAFPQFARQESWGTFSSFIH